METPDIDLEDCEECEACKANASKQPAFERTQDKVERPESGLSNWTPEPVLPLAAIEKEHVPWSRPWEAPEQDDPNVLQDDNKPQHASAPFAAPPKAPSTILAGATSSHERFRASASKDSILQDEEERA